MLFNENAKNGWMESRSRILFAAYLESRNSNVKYFKNLWDIKVRIKANYHLIGYSAFKVQILQTLQQFSPEPCLETLNPPDINAKKNFKKILRTKIPSASFPNTWKYLEKLWKPLQQRNHQASLIPQIIIQSQVKTRVD